MSFEEQFFILVDPMELEHGKVPQPVATPEVWTASVRELLRKINGTKCGDILLRSIRYHGRWVRIEPHLPSKIASKYCTADADGPTDTDKVMNQLSIFQFAGFRKIAAVVRITPQRYGAGTDCDKIYNIYPDSYRPEAYEILFHELVHAFRFVSGKHFDNGNPLRQVSGGLSLYDSTEEFFAILATNILASETKGNVRSSHHGHHKIDDRLKGSFEFYKISTKAFHWVDRFCKDHPYFTKELSKIKTSFNPLTAYYQNPAKASEYSRSAFAVSRDRGPFGTDMFGFTWDIWKNILH